MITGCWTCSTTAAEFPLSRGVPCRALWQTHADPEIRYQSHARNDRQTGKAVPRALPSAQENDPMPDRPDYVYDIRSSDVDGQGHANNVEVVRWMQEAAIRHSSDQGWDAARYRSEGISFVVRSHQIRYRESAGLGETIAIRTWISRRGRSSVERSYQIWRKSSNRIMVEATTEWALIQSETLRPARLPPDLIRSFPVSERDDEPPNWQELLADVSPE